MDEQGKCDAGEGGEGEEKKVSVKRSQGDTSFATACTNKLATLLSEYEVISYKEVDYRQKEQLMRRG